MTALRFTRLKRSRLGGVHELPAELPKDEHVLWQGAPAWWPLARSLHLRPVAAYFALMFAWYVIARVGHGATVLDVARVAGLSLAAVGLFALYALLACRTSSYTLTTKRVVLRTGIALPISFNIPFSRIENVDLRRNADGSGDLVLCLDAADTRLGFFVLWPHVRPWRMERPQPMLRAVKRIDPLARALAHQLEATAPTDQALPAAEPARDRRPDPVLNPAPAYPDPVTAAA
jgi:membrane protein YdbS with pleckstrin-like domain